jgi:hypothetical protein
MKEESGPAVIPFLGAHRPDDGHVFHVAGYLGQVLADADARDGSGDFLERPAVGVSRLQVKGVHLARTAVHPQEDAGAAPLRIS